uniref:Uncharacterized protein n=1 Tax=Cannabis sativa TaxID=3483 RepID=A0A803QH75_CANSA
MKLLFKRQTTYKQKQDENQQPQNKEQLPAVNYINNVQIPPFQVLKTTTHDFILNNIFYLPANQTRSPTTPIKPAAILVQPMKINCSSHDSVHHRVQQVLQLLRTPILPLLEVTRPVIQPKPGTYLSHHQFGKMTLKENMVVRLRVHLTNMAVLINNLHHSTKVIPSQQMIIYSLPTNKPTLRHTNLMPNSRRILRYFSSDERIIKQFSLKFPILTRPQESISVNDLSESQDFLEIPAAILFKSQQPEVFTL